MNEVLVFLVVMLTLINFALLGYSRLLPLIRLTGLMGIILGIVPFWLHNQAFSWWHTLALSGGSILIKGVLIPFLLYRALQRVATQREIKPYVGYTFSVLYAMLATVVSFSVAESVPRSAFFPAPKFIGVSLAMMLCGLFLLVARRQAVTQIIGYLILENSVYLFGVSLEVEQSWVVELGILLDLLVGIFIMGVVMHHIYREFENIDLGSLEELKL
jgi:hydrogenase-4 component E